MAKAKPIYGRKSDGTALSTQREAVLNYLMNGGRLTQEEARARWSTTRLPSLIKAKPIYGRKSDGTPISKQREAVLDYLMNGGRLTQEEARARWSTTRLPSLINVLRNQLAAQGGKFRIVTVMVQGKNRFGAPCRYGEYHLEKVED